MDDTPAKTRKPGSGKHHNSGRPKNPHRIVNGYKFSPSVAAYAIILKWKKGQVSRRISEAIVEYERNNRLIDYDNQDES